MHSHDALDGVAFKITSFDFNGIFMHKLKIVWLLQILLGKGSPMEWLLTNNGLHLIGIWDILYSNYKHGAISNFW